MSRAAIFFLLIIAPILALLLAWLGYVTLPTNLVGWFLLLVGVVYSGGVLIAYAVRRGQLRTTENANYSKEERGDRSFWFISVGMAAVFYLSPLEYLNFNEQAPNTSWQEIAGFSVVILGIVLFIWAYRTLGSGYSGHASIKEMQPLVQTGPYHYVRHPAYLGYLLMTLGITLGYWSLAGLMSILVCLLPSLMFRIGVEEKMLADHFGSEHQAYSKRTKRLIPGIW